jgi:CheY-like chemotaxis protein
MLRTSGKCPDGDVAEGLEVIERNARIQGKLIEDVLDVARIVSGKFHVEARPCDLEAVIGAAMDAVHHAADAKGVSLELRTDPQAGRMIADAARLQQVFWNLLSNAVKFTPRGGRVLIRLERSGSLARVVVSDTGKGISSRFLPYVFDRFKQADEGTTRVYGGLGLGLSLVRHIVELHGGSVRAQSDGEGRGATFTIELPVGVEPGPQHPPAVQNVHEPTPRLDGIRVLVVLVVDDEEDARTLLRKTLEAAGSEVLLAGTAMEAFRLALEKRPDVLISDIGMPMEDGYSLIRRIRAEGLSPKDLPAVALSAFAGALDRRRALLAGFQVHVAKPVDPGELIAVVASLTGRTGA